MIRLMRPSLRWFGVVAALLVLALPVQADDIEPEPYVEEEVAPEPEPAPEVEAEVEEPVRTQTAAAGDGRSVGSKIFDCMVLRPFGFAATLLGGVFFLPAAVLTSLSGADGIEAAWDFFVVTQVNNTFKRPLGDF